MSFKNFYLSVAEGKNRGIGALILKALLMPFSLLYSFFPLSKEILYETEIFKAGKVNAPVISVGNLSWGGTGKTPAVIEISKILKKRGISHAILSRGYGSNTDSQESLIISDFNEVLTRPPLASDENYLLAENLPGIPVIQDKDRCRGAMTAIEKFNIKCIILDDGYQHLKIERDINILLWDSRINPNTTYAIPAGTLRERKGAAHRADIIILTKTNQQGNISSVCESFFNDRLPGKTILHACHDISEIREYGKNESVMPSEISGKNAVAFCAIADSDSFKSTIEEAGVNIKEFISFRDHHHFLPQDIAALKNAMTTSGADFLITTEKDLSRSNDILKDAGKIIYPVIKFRIAEEEIFRDLMLKPFV